MKKILVTIPLEKEEMETFRKAAEGGDECEFLFREAADLAGGDLETVDAVIGMIDPALLRNAQKLEWLQICWAGAEPYCKEGVMRPESVLTNASGAYGNAVSEHMVAMTLALTCNLQIYVRQQEEHLFKQRKRFGVLSGCTVLVYGMGDIGSWYAAVVKAMGCKVIGISRTRKEKQEFFDEQYTAEEVSGVIGRADVIAMALPGGKMTEHMVGRDEIKLMKPGVIIVNAGRGSTIDTNALIEGLRDGTVGGAGLDVFEEEPLGESPLWDMENVIITPHAAGNIDNDFNRNRVLDICLDNLRRYTHGEELLHIVNREFFY